MLHVRELTRQFGTVTAVDGLSFRIDGAPMVGVIGRSGAGKSTLLRMINRLTDASAGQILVDGAQQAFPAGTDILTLTGRQRRGWQSQCAMIFQQFNLVPRLDVVTNVMLGRLYHKPWLQGLIGLFTDQDRLDALAILERLDIAALALQRAETLSGGQQQRVAIARALMQRPRILLADEPIASLDPRNARIVMDTLAAINRDDGILVICNLHTLDTARTYCQRIIGMAAGRLVFDGAADALSDETARQIYGVDGMDEAFSEHLTSTSLPGTVPPSGRRPGPSAPSAASDPDQPRLALAKG